jgi:mRNA-degrading endonuclease RelE of RelBE toxin-antitoxin system
MFEIEYAEAVADDLANVARFARKRILDEIEKQLRHEPVRPTRNKKILVGLKPPWEHVEPVWELRIGEYRVFYDVDDLVKRVIVRAVRHKPPHQTTEEIL